MKSNILHIKVSAINPFFDASNTSAKALHKALQSFLDALGQLGFATCNLEMGGNGKPDSSKLFFREKDELGASFGQPDNSVSQEKDENGNVIGESRRGTLRPHHACGSDGKPFNAAMGEGKNAEVLDALQARIIRSAGQENTGS